MKTVCSLGIVKVRGAMLCLLTIATLITLPMVRATIAADATTTAPAHAFNNTDVWPDTEGHHIDAHGGGILFHDGIYYWFGEERNPSAPGGPHAPRPRVECYSSTDLYNWKHLGAALFSPDDPSSDLTIGCIVERPKVIYNAKTNKFVMWFHLELKGKSYFAAHTALAVADQPAGPYRFIYSGRINAGTWPVGFPEQYQSPLSVAQAAELLKDKKQQNELINQGVYVRRDFAGGQMSRDMNLFVDDDGTAYLITAAEENCTLHLHELTPDYQGFTGKWTRIVPGNHSEGPALMKRDGKYFILASGCTGWSPNSARSFTADNIWGPWTSLGNPTLGVNPANNLGPEKTFGAQSTCILPVHGKRDAYIAMFDIWRPKKLSESSHVWLPIEFANGKMLIRWRQTWDLSVFDR